jgi:hypothetical protein
LKLLEINIGETVQDIGTSSIFLVRAPVFQDIKARN